MKGVVLALLPLAVSAAVIPDAPLGKYSKNEPSPHDVSDNSTPQHAVKIPRAKLQPVATSG